MKLNRDARKTVKLSDKLISDDMRYLQKKINGSSVYKKLSLAYKRKPKHKSIGYQY